MIDFRYHIVSIAAVFLALGIGVALGATVLDRVTVGALEARLADLRGSLDDARAEINERGARLEEADRLIAELGPRVVEGVLEGVEVVLVYGRDPTPWEGDALEALGMAGAEVVGSISLSERWADPEAVDELTELVRSLGIVAAGEDDPAIAAARLLGERLQDASGRELLAALAEEGYVRVQGTELDGTWPPSGVRVAVFTSSQGEDARVGPLAHLAASSAGLVATLVASGDLDDLGAVAQLRDAGSLPPRLSTFDSAAADPSGAGLVLAFRAAIEEQGGHFGRGSRLSYLPSSSSPESGIR